MRVIAVAAILAAALAGASAQAANCTALALNVSSCVQAAFAGYSNNGGNNNYNPVTQCCGQQTALTNACGSLLTQLGANFYLADVGAQQLVLDAAASCPSKPHFRCCCCVVGTRACGRGRRRCPSGSLVPRATVMSVWILGRDPLRAVARAPLGVVFASRVCILNLGRGRGAGLPALLSTAPFQSMSKQGLLAEAGVVVCVCVWRD